MATPAQKQELQLKLTALVNDRFGGDWQACFREYANADGLIAIGGLRDLLGAADVGNALTRGRWATEIMDTLDANHDRHLSIDEIEAAIE